MKKFLVSAAVALLAVSGTALAQTNVNVGHLAPFAPDVADTAVSVDVDGMQVLTGVTYNQFSGYLELAPAGTPPGSTLVEVRTPPGGAVAISDTFSLAADTNYSVLAIGDGSNQPLQLLPLIDDLTPPATGNVKIRVVHAAPFAASLPDTAVSVRTQGGDVVGGLNSVEFGQDSGFLEVPAGQYDFLIATPDGSTPLIDPVPVSLPGGTIVTLYAVGDGSNQPLGITAVFGDGTATGITTRVGDARPIPTLGMIGLLALSCLVLLVGVRNLR